MASVRVGPADIVGLVRLLGVIEEFRASRGRDPYTRELLALLGGWGYGESLLLLAWGLGLVERYDDYCDGRGGRVCRFNRLSERGREFLRRWEGLVSLLGVSVYW